MRIIGSYYRSEAGLKQKLLFCPECGGLPAIAGLCQSCYARRRHSQIYFAGVRDRVLARDGYRCQGCGAVNQRPVHHRGTSVRANPASLQARRSLISRC